MKENQAASSDSSSALLSGKILQFKKSLSFTGNTENIPIVQSYQDSSHNRGILQNPLRSLDYLTADCGNFDNSNHASQAVSTTVSQGSSTGRAAQSITSDNILINKIRKIASAPYKIIDAPHL